MGWGDLANKINAPMPLPEVAPAQGEWDWQNLAQRFNRAVVDQGNQFQKEFDRDPSQFAGIGSIKSVRPINLVTEAPAIKHMTDVFQFRNPPEMGRQSAVKEALNYFEHAKNAKNVEDTLKMNGWTAADLKGL